MTSLSLIGNTFPQDGMELAQSFACLGPNLLMLDLYFTALDKFSTEHLKQLKNSLSLDGAFNSGHTPPGAKFSYTYTKPGTYNYKCTIHPLLGFG